MTVQIDILLVLLVMTNLFVLGASRLVSCIRGAAVQGALLGALVLAVHAHHLDLRNILLAVVSTGLKTFVFPQLLMRAVRDTQGQRESKPFIGYTTSQVFGIIFVLFGAWLGSRLPLPPHVDSALAVPVAFSTALVGLFLVVSRKKALTQVVGYLVLENGIFAFGVLFVRGTPWLMELGVLLDVFMGVFVMGIAIFHINAEFDHIDTDRLNSLHDLTVDEAGIAAKDHP